MKIVLFIIGVFFSTFIVGATLAYLYVPNNKVEISREMFRNSDAMISVQGKLKNVGREPLSNVGVEVTLMARGIRNSPFQTLSVIKCAVNKDSLEVNEQTSYVCVFNDSPTLLLYHINVYSDSSAVQIINNSLESIDK